ncbi:MAG TPA: cytochrome P450 [Bryobacteraceae bacterium]|nr:cytochrome P450 [Bryobacteraceae bacterium]
MGEPPRPEPGADFWATEPPEPPCFDRARNSWILSRYRDVAAALRDPRLVPVSPLCTAAAVPLDGALHAEFREEGLRLVAPARLRQWEGQFALLAHRLAAALPAGREVDLVAEYAKPWSREVAGMAAGLPGDQLERLDGLAGAIFDAACQAYDVALEAKSRNAVQELARFFRGAPQLHMQMFIALAHSLPAFLGNAWLALAEHPAQWLRLRQEAALLPKAIDELLRFAGPAKAQFRQAVAKVALDGGTVSPQERVILRLDRANRDPERFPDPQELRIDGRTGDHVALGGGVHACIGGMLIRAAAAVATRALLDSCGLPARYTAVTADGFAMHYVKSLRVARDAPAPLK